MALSWTELAPVDQPRDPLADFAVNAMARFTAADLDLSDAAQLERDAVLRDAVDLDGDLPRGQRKDERLLHDRIDDRATPDDDATGSRSARGVPTGDDERLSWHVSILQFLSKLYFIDDVQVFFDFIRI